MISKRRIMVGLKARSREHSCRKVGMPLRSAPAVSETSFGRVRRSLERTLITARKLNEWTCAKPALQINWPGGASTAGLRGLVQ
jgi:hypothetical protein